MYRNEYRSNIYQDMSNFNCSRARTSGPVWRVTTSRNDTKSKGRNDPHVRMYVPMWKKENKWKLKWKCHPFSFDPFPNTVLIGGTFFSTWSLIKKVKVLELLKWTIGACMCRTMPKNAHILIFKNSNFLDITLDQRGVSVASNFELALHLISFFFVFSFSWS